jgi:hypothetical protein
LRKSRIFYAITGAAFNHKGTKAQRQHDDGVQCALRSEEVKEVRMTFNQLSRVSAIGEKLWIGLR